MDCQSHITLSPDGHRRVVHCRVCKLRRAMGDNESFACPAGGRIRCGPGCQLRRTLSWFGLKDDGTCGCAEYAAQMDAWGVDGCWSRLEEIVDHLRGAAEKRGVPFIATAARIAVSRAIEAARAES